MNNQSQALPADLGEDGPELRLVELLHEAVMGTSIKRVPAPVRESARAKRPELKVLGWEARAARMLD